MFNLILLGTRIAFNSALQVVGFDFVRSALVSEIAAAMPMDPVFPIHEHDTEVENDGVSIPWYAVHVRPNYEKTVARVLQNKGVEEYLPLYTERRRWSDRFVDTELPLFPGYVFCKLDWTRRILPVLTTPGVLRVLGVGRIPAPVDEQELQAVRLVVKSGLAVRPWPMPRIGEWVRIEHGPLTGVEGVLVGVKNQTRLVVSVTLMNRSVAAEIESRWARPVTRPKRRPVDAARAFPGSISLRNAVS